VPALALLFLAAYGTLAVGVRMLVQLRRTGSPGFAGVHSTPERVAATLLVAGSAAAAAGPLLDLAGALAPLAALEGEIARAAGVGMAAGGLVTTAGAQLAMGDAWRIGQDESERTELVTDGPFSVVRNPIYSAMVPFFTGVALMVPSPVTLAAPLLVLAAVELQTRLVEEPFLLDRHGRAYAAYARRVGRFLPGVGRLKEPG
jgi:protein-S-isoprenylcysteine O-methyltransferase Ste14